MTQKKTPMRTRQWAPIVVVLFVVVACALGAQGPGPAPWSVFFAGLVVGLAVVGVIHLARGKDDESGR